MKPMIWKELRENLHWALLAAIVLALAYAFDINQWPEQGWTLSRGAYPNSSALFTPMVALLLGLVQIVPELRRDQWAFLVHRPVSRTTLFWGKAVPGLLLYFMATVIPLIGSALWIHRHFPSRAPFDLRMLQGAFADILTGAIFYFAALLVAIRPVRWYGSRVLPLFAAVSCAPLLSILPQFSYGVAAILVVTLLFMAAAHGSFVKFGEYRGQSAAAKFCMGVVLLFGLLGAGIFFVALTANSIPNFEPSEESLGARSQLKVPIYVVDKHGDMVKVKTSQHGGYTYPTTWTAERKDVTYIDGRRWSDSSLPPENARAKAWPSELIGPQDTLEPLTYMGRDSVASFRSPTPYRWWSEQYTTLYVPHSGSIKYVSDTCFYSEYQRRVLYFSNTEHKVVGYAGPGGYYPAEAEPAQGAYFSSKLLKRVEDNILWFSDGVYRIEPEKHRVTRLVAARGQQDLLDVSLVKIDVSGKRYLFVLKDRSIEAYSLNGKLLFTIPLSDGLIKLPRLKVYVPRSGDRISLWFTSVPAHYGEPDWKDISQLVVISPEGKIISSDRLPALPVALPPLSPRELAAACLVGLTAPTNAGVLFNLLPYSPSEGMLLILTSRPVHPGIVRLVLMLGFFTCLLSIVAIFWLARRCSLTSRQRWMWLIVAFLFGPSGALLALATLPWPARVKCPQCAKPRDVHHDLCEHCGAPFPPPQPDGTEIFA